MWAQSMVEYGVLDSAIAGVNRLASRIDYTLGDGATRWVLAGGGVIFLYWVFRRR